MAHRDQHELYGLAEQADEAHEPEGDRPSPGKVTLTAQLPRRRGAVRRSMTTAQAARPSPPDPETARQFASAVRPDLPLGPEGGAAPAPVERALSSSAGAAIPEPARAALERSYGSSLADVRVHDDASADAAARSIQAKAFAHGGDIYFRGGHYRPDTPDGFELLAHEAAHTVQSADSVVQSKLEVAPGDDAAERDADRAAAAAVRGERASISRLGAGVARRIHRTDMREGTSIPDAGTQQTIRNELYPAQATVGGAPAPNWDGLAEADGTVSAAAQTARADLKARVTAALVQHLADVAADVGDVASRRKLPMTSLEGPGRAAKAVTDAQFSSWATASALTAPQRHTRAAHQFRASGADQNLFDATDAGERTRAGQGIDPWDLANWMSETDDASAAAQRAHNFDPYREQPDGSKPEEDFLWDEILADFVPAHEADLRRYDLFMFGMADPDTGNIVIGPQVAGHLSDTSPGGGAPSPAERFALWSAWRTLVHEYIHTLEHPACQSWPGRNRVIGEGFCEMFTKVVLVAELPGAASNVGLRTQIEGADHGEPGPDIIGGPHDPGEYADYMASAERIRDAIGGTGGDNAVRGAFFQGHMELLGFDTDGNDLTAPAGSGDMVTAPPSIASVADMAVICNVTEDVIRGANAPDDILEPLVGARMHVPGCREHLVVTASDGASTQAETLDIIAEQHGITTALLQAANPDVDFAALTQNQTIIIPNH